MLEHTRSERDIAELRVMALEDALSEANKRLSDLAAVFGKGLAIFKTEDPKPHPVPEVAHFQRDDEPAKPTPVQIPDLAKPDPDSWRDYDDGVAKSVGF